MHRPKGRDQSDMFKKQKAGPRGQIMKAEGGTVRAVRDGRVRSWESCRPLVIMPAFPNLPALLEDSNWITLQMEKSLK